MVTIDYYFVPTSPYAYLAGLRLEEIAARHGAAIAYKPFDLVRIFGEVGTPKPADRHPAKQRYRLQDLARVSRRTGLPINLHPAHWPTNPVPASAAIITANQAGGGDTGRLVHALMRACWAEDRNIADEAVIEAALAEAGFEPGLAGRGLLSGVEAFERNTEAARHAGVFGAPTYIVGEEIFWGGDRLPYLDDHLAALG